MVIETGQNCSALRRKGELTFHGSFTDQLDEILVLCFFFLRITFNFKLNSQSATLVSET